MIKICIFKIIYSEQKADDFITSLDNYQFTLNKSLIIKNTCLKEINNYKELENKISIKLLFIDSQLSEINDNIQILKQQLEKANQEKDHLMEYETLAKKIKDYPSRNNSEEYFFIIYIIEM